MLRRKRGLREVEENNLEIKGEIVRQEKGSKLLLFISKQIWLSVQKSRNIQLLLATAASIYSADTHPRHSTFSNGAFAHHQTADYLPSPSALLPCF